jgi:hypothetical protein
MHRENSTATQPIPRGAPAFANDQRSFVLRKLQEAGERGVSRATFIFEHRVTQCGARIDELKRQGYRIESELRSGDRYVTYVLRGEPAEPKPLPTFQQKKLSGDWFERSGKKRPGPDYGPLFDVPTSGGAS